MIFQVLPHYRNSDRPTWVKTKNFSSKYKNTTHLVVTTLLQGDATYLQFNLGGAVAWMFQNTLPQVTVNVIVTFLVRVAFTFTYIQCWLPPPQHN